jgi:hypothetical protein
VSHSDQGVVSEAFPLIQIFKPMIWRVLQADTAKAQGAYEDFLTLWKDADSSAFGSHLVLLPEAIPALLGGSQ